MTTTRHAVEGFFHWIWRLNSLLLLVLIGSGIAVLYMASQSDTLVGRNRVAQDGIVGGAPGAPRARLSLGLMRDLTGTPMLYAPLKADRPASGMSLSGFKPADVRNVLFFDLARRTEHWLFSDNRQVISRPEVLERRLPPTTPGTRPGKQARGMIFGVRPMRDGVAGPALWNIDLASVDGRRVKTIASAVDGMMGFHYTPDETALLVFYTSRGSAYVLAADLETFEVRSNRKLATPE